MSFLKNVFSPNIPEAIEPGFYAYTAPQDDPLNYRLHLRIDQDGTGSLIVNASTVLHLNETAATYAYFLVNQSPLEEMVQHISKRYRVKKERVEEDYAEIKDMIETLITTQDLDPVLYLGMDLEKPYENLTSAPMRLDCALTYEQTKGKKNAILHKRVDRELNTEEWKTIIQKSWDQGIPHVLFTGGEPTLRKDLVELLQFSEDLGQVTGLLTNGSKLVDKNYLNSLLQAGLDHAVIILDPDDKNAWKSLASFDYWSHVLDEDLAITAHITITKDNAGAVNEMIDKISETEIKSISLSINDAELIDNLHYARMYVDDTGLNLVWDLPVPYSHLNPVELEKLRQDSLFEVEDQDNDVDGAGRGWLYVEPDGDVLPEQGINVVLGNMLRDEWESIWDAAKNWYDNKRK